MEQSEEKEITAEDNSKTDDETFTNRFRKVFYSQMVDIKVEGQLLTISKAILTEASPVFKTMLENEHFVEGKTQTIEFPDKIEEDILMMLTFITPRLEFEPNPMIDPRKMLKFADEYQIASLTTECEKVLIAEIATSNISLEYEYTQSANISLEHVYLAQKYKLRELLHTAVNECATIPAHDLMIRTRRSFEQKHPDVVSAVKKDGKESLGDDDILYDGIVELKHFLSICRKREGTLAYIWGVLCGRLNLNPYILPLHSPFLDIVKDTFLERL